MLYNTVVDDAPVIVASPKLNIYGHRHVHHVNVGLPRMEMWDYSDPGLGTFEMCLKSFLILSSPDSKV